MIKETDLLEAIAECQGERNPNANTCIKLAAFYTILDNIRKETDSVEKSNAPFTNSYSYDPPHAPVYESKTEFGEVISRNNVTDVLRVLDEMMETIRTIHPKLYEAVMRELTALE